MSNVNNVNYICLAILVVSHSVLVLTDINNGAYLTEDTNKICNKSITN